MNKGFITIVGAAALVASTAGFAGTTTAVNSAPLGSHAGFYINPNIGYGYYDVNITQSEKNEMNNLGISYSRNSFAWSSNLGYQFNPYFAVEVGYMQLPYLQLKYKGANNGTVRDRVMTHAVTFVAKGIYPVTERINLFGKAGIAYETQSNNVHQGDITVIDQNNVGKVTPLFGLGANYYITRNWAVGVQGITTLKNGNEFPATYTGLVGVTYKFS